MAHFSDSLGGTHSVVVGDGVAASAIAAGLRTAGSTVAVLKTDATDPDDVARAFAALDSELPSLDAAVIVPGPTGTAGPAEFIEPDEWDAVLDARLNAVFWCAQQAARRMLPRGQGSIVAVSSLAGVLVDKNDRRAHLHAANAAIDTLAKGLAVEWGDRGVRVNTVAPGALGHGAEVGTAVDEAERVIAATPLRRLGTIEDIVDAVLFLCSSASSYFTGQTLVADGGRGLLFN